MDYHSHLSKFIEKAAVVDYFLTGLIVYRFIPTFQGEGKQLSEEFLDCFVRDKENGITFGRKISLFTAIATKNYPKILEKYAHLSKPTLKLINNHRNTLAHSFAHPSDNKEAVKKKTFILTSFNPDWKTGKAPLPFNKCKDMEKAVQNTINDMSKFYKELGIIP
jgi:hypothetical protein